MQFFEKKFFSSNSAGTAVFTAKNTPERLLKQHDFFRKYLIINIIENPLQNALYGNKSLI